MIQRRAASTVVQVICAASESAGVLIATASSGGFVESEVCVELSRVKGLGTGLCDGIQGSNDSGCAASHSSTPGSSLFTESMVSARAARRRSCHSSEASRSRPQSTASA